MKNWVVLSLLGIKMVRASYRRHRVPRRSPPYGIAVRNDVAFTDLLHDLERCDAAWTKHKVHLEKPLNRHRGKEGYPAGLPTCRLRNCFLSHPALMKRKTGRKKRAQAHANSRGGASLLQRRFCGFAKPGKLRDPEASERSCPGRKRQDPSEL